MQWMVPSEDQKYNMSERLYPFLFIFLGKKVQSFSDILYKQH
jgi:hypothetical protein